MTIYNHSITYNFDIQEIKNLDPVLVFLQVCKRNDVHIVVYLMRRFNQELRIHVEDMLGMLINDKWFNVSKYLALTINSEENLVDRCCYEGQVACCSWLLDHVDDIHNVKLDKGYDLAVSKGNLNIVLFLFMNSYTDRLDISFKINHDKRDIIQILHNYHLLSKECCFMLYPRLDGSKVEINHELIQLFEQYCYEVHPLD